MLKEWKVREHSDDFLLVGHPFDVPTLFFRSTLPKIVGQNDLVKQALGGVDQRVVAIAMSGSNSSRRLVEYFIQEHIRKRYAGAIAM